MVKALTCEQMNEVETHFILAREERLMVEEIRERIAEAVTYAIEPTGVHGSGTSDITAERASLIEKETRELRLWGDVVTETFAHFQKDVLMLNLLNLLYVERISPEIIMDTLYISKTTMYEYRKEILRYAALKAVSKGIMEV